jgi:hypothetical protein
LTKIFFLEICLFFFVIAWLKIPNSSSYICCIPSLVLDHRSCVRKFESFWCVFIVVYISYFGWLDIVIFGLVKFIALLSVHVCAVACVGLEMLHNTSHWVLLNYFMNKSYGSLLKLNIKLNGKTINYTSKDPMCVL